MTATATPSVVLQRASLRTLSVVAPSLVERLVVDRFTTPSRARRSVDDAPLGEPWYVYSEGERIAVYTAGDGPRVLFVHGWEGAASDFASLARAFQERGFGVVTFDQPAHGRSSGKRTTLPKMARAVLDVARATGPFVAVVGHSLGASSVLLAARDGLATQRAVLISPPRDARDFIHMLGQRMGITAARIAGAIARLERKIGAVGGRETDRVANQLRLPGLVLHDRDDRAVPFSHGVAIAAAWPGARFVPLSGVGHRRSLDSEAVHEEILNFVIATGEGEQTRRPRT
jgi:pimeloyl-ACP methyl ester carboxylesterase